MTPDTGDDEGPDGGGTGAPAESDPADAFAALSDPVRVDILRALAAHNREVGHGESVGFADLRRRVGVRDSGRFRYHLNELRGRFVAKTDDGYRLTHVGQEVVAAVLAGTYTGDVALGPATLDSECPRCGAAAVAAYEEGYCRVTCDSGHLLFGWRLPPSAAAGDPIETVVERAELFARQAIERLLTGLCPYCYDAVDPSLTTDADVDDSRRSLPVDDDAANELASTGADAPSVRFGTACDTCGGWFEGPVGFILLVDPEVSAFYRRHGRSLRRVHVWEPVFVHEDVAVTVTDEDPLRVEVTARLDDDTIVVTVDERGRVVSVTE